MTELSAGEDRDAIEAYLRRNAPRRMYELGDLDARFAPSTRWFGEIDNGGLAALAMVYHGSDPWTLLALDETGNPRERGLLGSIAGLLPDRTYCHLTPGFEEYLEKDFELEDRGLHLKMESAHPEMLSADEGGIRRLGARDLDEITELYRLSYPGNWFDPQMLDTGCYYGAWAGGRLASVAGVHVVSQRYRAAALGNIATRPGFRGRGLAGRTASALCRDLAGRGMAVGLNVKADNRAAIQCYANIGFIPCGEYREALAVRRQCPLRP